MKKVLLIALMLLPLLLNSIIVPYSKQLIKMESNHMSGMERIAPPDREQIPLATDCWMWHDSKNLYVYWELEIDNDFIPGAFATRDDNQTSDYVRLQIKTIKNEDFAYYFSAFPRGTAFDAVRKENLQIDRAWNSLYECTSNYTDKLWTCTMIVPFKDLRFEGNPPYQWSFSVARQVQSTVSSFSNPFNPVSGMSTRQYYDSLEPLIINEQIDMPQSYKVIPYFYRSYDMISKTNTFDPKHIGLNLIYRPTNNSSAKFAFNPDFTEVPVDEERDSHNDKYAPQLAENRIFFTEDLNAFGVGDGQFYSRNIMQPQFAAKFTASGSNWSMGFLSAKDKKTEIDGITINPDDFYNLIAFKHKNNQLVNQFTVLSRSNSSTEYNNTLIQIAPTYEFSPSFRITTKFFQTFDKVKNNTVKKGNFAYLALSKNFSDVLTSLAFRIISKDYIPGMGSEYAKYDVNLVSGDFSIDYSSHFRNSILRTQTFGLYGNVKVEKEDLNKIRSADFSLNETLTFTPQFNIPLNINIGNDRLHNDKLINYGSISSNIAVSRWRLISGYAGVGYNKSIIYSLINPQKNYDNYNYFAGINGYIGPVISYIFRNNHIIWKELPSDEEYFSGVKGDKEYDITNLDMELTFSNDLKLVMGLRYNNYERYGFSQHVGYFCTMHYLINSSTTLYLGFKAIENEYIEEMYKESESAWFKITKTF